MTSWLTGNVLYESSTTNMRNVVMLNSAITITPVRSSLAMQKVATVGQMDFAEGLTHCASVR